MGRIRAFFRQKYIKNTFIIVLICATIGLLIYQGLWATRLSLNKHTKDLTWYGIDGTFHPQDRRLDCQHRVNYINKEDTHLFNIYFHIYPNAFKYEDKAVFPQEYMTRAYPNGFSPGSIEFKDILVDGEPAQFSIEGYSDDILMVTLKEALMPQDAMEIWMEYSIELPNSPGRFGYYDNTFNMGNWYPILCVYDEKGWNLEPYHSTGDPFYSNVSNYKV
ncbi:MAG TPA: M1 family peptidase, partial [Clostridia bacterium]|nr:M1 family peptidase [Clostridia bacterium]